MLIQALGLNKISFTEVEIKILRDAFHHPSFSKEDTKYLAFLMAQPKIAGRAQRPDGMSERQAEISMIFSLMECPPYFRRRSKDIQL